MLKCYLKLHHIHFQDQRMLSWKSTRSYCQRTASTNQRRSSSARVMLMTNLHVSLGLVSGALGTVVDVVYDVKHHSPDLPSCVLVQFDHLTGRNITVRADMDGVVPPADATECTRTQIPLALGWVITGHKYRTVVRNLTCTWKCLTSH